MGIQDISALIQTLAALVGIPMLLWQLRQVRKSMFTQSLTSIYSSYLEMDRFFIENPELRKYIYDCEPLDDSNEELRSKIHATAEYTLDVLYQSYAQREFLGDKAFVSDQNFLRRICKSPAIRSYVSKHGDQFDRAFLRYAGCD